jgi:two-component system sensor histidine kinase/response regulator
MKKKNNIPLPGPLRVLILEDNPADAELVIRELQRTGFTFTHQLVDGKREFSKVLKEFQPQVILSDFKLPRFDGLAALEMTRLKAPEVPFIFVSGSIGEEKAIETLTLGAADYIFKGNLKRLGSAVKRALAAVALNKQKKDAEKSLRASKEHLQQSEEYYHTLVETSPDAIVIVDAGSRVRYASNKTYELFDVPAEAQLIGSEILDFVEKDEIPRVQARMVEILSGQSRAKVREYRLHKHDGQPFWGEVSSAPLQDAKKRNTGLLFIIRDVSQRKQTEMIQAIQYNIAKAVVAAENLNDLFDVVRKELGSLLDTTNFLIALYDEGSNMLTAPFERDEKDAITQWPVEKSLTGLVAIRRKSLLLNWEEIQHLAEAGEIELIGSRAESWLGVPLQIGDKALGAIVVQSYNDPRAYDENSIKVLEIIANQLSVYIVRKQTETELKRRNKELERFNRASAGREVRMIELKQKVNELSRQLGQPPPYPLAFLPQDGQAATGPKSCKNNEPKGENKP